MLRKVLLFVGCLLLFFQYNIAPFDVNIQCIIFLSGILFLGVPHGAADLLVAAQHANNDKNEFSQFRFLVVYLSRIVTFALILWILPVVGIILFIFFAAYHFGETDLFKFKTDSLSGKLFIISYGILILSVVLMYHFEEVKPILQLFSAGKENTKLINWLDNHQNNIISISGILFFTCTFVYFLRNNNLDLKDNGEFLIRLTIILLILFNLPMLLGFTFYFVVWHSILSLNNIITYLQKSHAYKGKSVARQIIIFSIIAISGIFLFGLTGFMFISSNSIMGFLFLGLAVLTAPHMQIMHDMYNNLRQLQSAKS